jgi:hypothetical protein
LHSFHLRHFVTAIASLQRGSHSGQHALAPALRALRRQASPEEGVKIAETSANAEVTAPRLWCANRSVGGLRIAHPIPYQQQCGVSMLRIETETDGAWMILRLIGRIRFDCINELRERVQKRTSLLILDLAEVDIVDLQSVWFLRDCQDRRIELRNCAPYILEWIRRERVER